jgi:hypothetical protein
MKEKIDNVEKNVENKYDNKNYWDFKKRYECAININNK